MTDRKALQRITRTNNPKLGYYYQEYIDYLKKVEDALIYYANNGWTYCPALCCMHYYADFKRWCDNRDLDLFLSTIPSTIMDDGYQILDCVISWHSRTTKMEITESH